MSLTVIHVSCLSFQKYPKHAKYRIAGPENLSEMDVMFDKAFVDGHLSIAAGAVDLTDGTDPQEEESNEVEQQEDVGDCSEPVKQTTQRKGKRGRSAGTNVDGSPYYSAYKSALDKWTAHSCETSSTPVVATIPSIADCMGMIRELGIPELSPMFVKACKMLKEVENREIFSNLTTAEGKQAFLDAC